jgi:hypothetical protein
VKTLAQRYQSHGRNIVLTSTVGIGKWAKSSCGQRLPNYEYA